MDTEQVLSRRATLKDGRGRLHCRIVLTMNRKLSKLNAWTRMTSVDFGESMNSGPFKGMSPLRTMLLTTSYGCEMLIQASGPDADEALDEMEYALLAEHFDRDGKPVPGGKRHRNRALEARMFARDRQRGKLW